MSTLDDLFGAFYDWIVATGSAAGALTEDPAQVVDGRASDPNTRPDLPFIEVLPLTFDQEVGHDEQIERQVTADDTAALAAGFSVGDLAVWNRGTRRATVSVTGYGATAAGWLERAHQRLYGPTAQAIFDAAGFDVQPAEAAALTVPVVDTAKEQTYNRDYEVYYLLVEDVPEAQRVANLIQVATTWTSGSSDDRSNTVDIDATIS